MSMFFRFSILLLLVSFGLGCSWANNRYVQSGAIGGAAGAATGAGTGALVGSLISSGDVAGSAILGGAIGLPAGILIGVAVQSYMDDTAIEENNSEIAQNYEYIVQRQSEIDALREEIASDYQSIVVDRGQRREIYTSPTIGIYN